VRHRWKTVYQSIPGEPAEHVTFCDECGAEYAAEFTQPESCDDMVVLDEASVLRGID
jgi:hypothetical protein